MRGYNAVKEIHRRALNLGNNQVVDSGNIAAVRKRLDGGGFAIVVYREKPGVRGFDGVFYCGRGGFRLDILWRLLL
jgi:hypothetical protein